MKFIAENDQLTIRLENIEVLLGLKRALIMPRASIVDLNWYPEYSFDKKVYRMAGAGIVNILYAGHFRGSGLRYFFYLRNPRGISWANSDITSNNTLVITLQDYPYAQVLVTCQPDIGAQLMKWWRTT
jgi:hypothetical protein